MRPSVHSEWRFYLYTLCVRVPEECQLEERNNVKQCLPRAFTSTNGSIHHETLSPCCWSVWAASASSLQQGTCVKNYILVDYFNLLIQNTLEIEIYSNYEKFRWCINCSRIFVQIYGPSTIYNIIFNRW